MHTSAVSGNTWSKVVFGLTTVLLVFAPLTARPGGAAEAAPGRNPLDLTICSGYFALCAASTCTPNPGHQIAVHTAPEVVGWHERPLRCRVSDAGPSQLFARALRAGVRKPPRKEPADRH